MTYTLEIGGKKTPFKQITVDQEGIASVRTRLPALTEIAPEDTLVVKHGSTVKFDGVVEEITQLTKTVKEIYGRDRTRVLLDKFCVDTGFQIYDDKKAGVIVRSLIDHYFSGILTRNDVQDGSLTLVHVDFTDWSVYDAIAYLCMAAEMDCYVDSDNDVNFFPSGSHSSGKTVVWGKHILDAQRTDSILEVRRKVRVRGKDVEATASTGSGRPELAPISDTRITTQAQAQQIADLLLNWYKNQEERLEVHAKGWWDVRATQTVVFNAPKYGLNNVSKTIASISFVISPNDCKTVFRKGMKTFNLGALLSRFLHPPSMQKITTGGGASGGLAHADLDAELALTNLAALLALTGVGAVGAYAGGSVGGSYTGANVGSKTTGVTNLSAGYHTHLVERTYYDIQSSGPSAGTYHVHTTPIPYETVVSSGVHGHTINDPSHTNPFYDASHANPFTDPGHGHGITDPKHGTSLSDPKHDTPLKDPGHVTPITENPHFQENPNWGVLPHWGSGELFFW